MTALVTGALGQLGQELRTLLSAETIWTDVRADADLQVQALDVTDRVAVQSLIGSVRPEVVYHCAAYTNVDGAESNPLAAQAVNVDGSAAVAVAAQTVGAKLVVISTDFVFDGATDRPYDETDEPRPLSVYGQTKLDGERAAQAACERAFVVRTAWLYGPSVAVAPVKNFPQTMRRLAAERSQLTVVNDQVGSPTFTKDLAESIVRLVATERYGIWHIANRGRASWYEFAREILHPGLTAGTVTVDPIPSSEYPTAATRPAFSVLDTTKFTSAFGSLRPWQDALTDYLGSLQ